MNITWDTNILTLYAHSKILCTHNSPDFYDSNPLISFLLCPWISETIVSHSLKIDVIDVNPSLDRVHLRWSEKSVTYHHFCSEGICSFTTVFQGHCWGTVMLQLSISGEYWEVIMKSWGWVVTPQVVTVGKELMQQEQVPCEPVPPALAICLCFKGLLGSNLVYGTSSW